MTLRKKPRPKPKPDPQPGSKRWAFNAHDVFKSCVTGGIALVAQVGHMATAENIGALASKEGALAAFVAFVLAGVHFVSLVATDNRKGPSN